MTQINFAHSLRKAAPVLACISIFGMVLGLLTPLLSVRMQLAGASSTSIGFLAASTAMATMLVGPFVPKMARLFGARGLMLTGIGLSLLIMPSFELIRDWHFWFPIRFLLSSALTTLFVLTEIWINAVTPNEIRGRMLGLYVSGLSGGFMIGPIILTFVGTDGPWPIMITTGLIMIAAIPVLASRTPSPVFEDHQGPSMWRLMQLAPAIYCAAFAYGGIETAFFGLMPVHATANGLSVATMALLLSTMAAGQVVLQVPIGMLSDRLDRRFVLMVCAITGIAGMVILAAYPRSEWVLATNLFLWGGIVVGFYTVGLTILGERHKGAELVSVNAVFSSFYGLGALVGPAATGAVMDAIPTFGLPLALGVISAMVLVPITLAWLKDPALIQPRHFAAHN
jgi:MFS family permease